MIIKKICFVGYGDHVKNTIIPFLQIKKKNIKIITKKVISENFETFKDIELAVNNLDSSYIFYNSTPPREHFLTSKKVLNFGFNLIVEKPICVSASQYVILKKIADKKGLFLFENMMYLFSEQFLVFNKEIKQLDKIKKIEMNFSIPSFSPNSFRNTHHIENSLLYDVGCYPISLISFLGLKLNKIKLKSKRKNKILSLLHLSATSKKININIKIGFYKKYKNYVKVKFLDNTCSTFNHFFYGKKIKKENVKLKKTGELKKTYINEMNIFKKVFNFSYKKMFMISESNEKIIINYLKILDSIKQKIR